MKILKWSRRAAADPRRPQAAETQAPEAPGRSDLPPQVAVFMAAFGALGCSAEPSAGGTVWTVRDSCGNTVVESRTGPCAGAPRRPGDADDGCVELSALWGDPAFRHEQNCGLVDLYGRPLHPEATDFLGESHTPGHDR